jgi:signal transduction histidine kinase
VTHRLRVLAALVGLLAITVAGTWFIAGRLALFPLLDALASERVDTALYLARSVESSADPPGRAWELSQELGLEVDPVASEPEPDARYRVIRRQGHQIRISREPALPLYVSANGLPVWGMTVRFPVDIEQPRRRVGWGFPILGLVVLAGAVLTSGWVLRPLRRTSAAMERVARGDLDVRVPEGDDEAGHIGATFNRMAERVATMLRGQRRLVAGVSHELRTPLARMRLLTELLRDSGADPARLDALEAEIASVDALGGELLESARLDEGVLALRREKVSLLALVEQALDAVAMGERRSEVAIPAELSLSLDRVRMLRVLTNLLSNVARYTPSSASIRVEAETVEGDGGPWTRITVADDGPGVPPEDLPQLFEPFYRAEQSRSKATGGLGLGLMLVKQIVEAHGGRIAAANRPQGGLRVTIDLPGDQDAAG